MLAVLCYLVAGLVAVVAAIWGLAGPWWALLVAGVALLTLGVLEARGAGVARAPADEAAAL